jgi:CheY-like chemotaxis protein
MSRPRILIAEDDPHLRGLFALLVRRMGNADYTAVSDGKAALEHLHDRHYDVVVLDLMMPQVNGYEVIDAMARMSRPRPAVIVVSAALDTSELNAEVVTFVVRKPFDIELMAAILEETAQRLANTTAPRVTVRTDEPESLRSY